MPPLPIFKKSSFHFLITNFRTYSRNLTISVAFYGKFAIIWFLKSFNFKIMQFWHIFPESCNWQVNEKKNARGEKDFPPYYEYGGNWYPCFSSFHAESIEVFLKHIDLIRHFCFAFLCQKIILKVSLILNNVESEGRIRLGRPRFENCLANRIRILSGYQFLKLKCSSLCLEGTSNFHLSKQWNWNDWEILSWIKSRIMYFIWNSIQTLKMHSQL